MIIPKLSSMEGEIKELKGEMKAVNTRIDSLENEMNIRLESLRNEMIIRFESLEEKLKVEEKMAELERRLALLESRS